MLEFVPFRSSFAGRVRSLRAFVNFPDVEALYRESRQDIYNTISSNAGLVLRLRIIICLQALFSKKGGMRKWKNHFIFVLSLKEF